MSSNNSLLSSCRNKLSIFSSHVWYIFLEGIDHCKPSNKHLECFPCDSQWKKIQMTMCPHLWTWDKLIQTKKCSLKTNTLWNNDKSNTLSNKKAQLNLLVVLQSYHKHCCTDIDERTEYQFLKILMSSSCFQQATANVKYLSTKRNQFINHQNYGFMVCIKLSIFRCNLWHFFASSFLHFHILQLQEV